MVVDGDRELKYKSEKSKRTEKAIKKGSRIGSQE